MKTIYVGLGGTAPAPEGWKDGTLLFHHTKMYVHPLIEGISDNLWKRIFNETNDFKPMFGKDGSKVYTDLEDWGIFRVVNGKRIRIANITEVG